MGQKVIFPEDMAGEENKAFERLMALVPAGDQVDPKLKRFLAFRMRIDGGEATRAFLLEGIEHARENAFRGSLYEYLVGRESSFSDKAPDNIPPDEHG